VRQHNFSLEDQQSRTTVNRQCSHIFIALVPQQCQRQGIPDLVSLFFLRSLIRSYHSFYVFMSNGVIHDTRVSVHCNVNVLSRSMPTWLFVMRVWWCRWHAWDACSCFFNGSNTTVASHFPSFPLRFLFPHFKIASTGKIPHWRHCIYYFRCLQTGVAVPYLLAMLNYITKVLSSFELYLQPERFKERS